MITSLIIPTGLMAQVYVDHSTNFRIGLDHDGNAEDRDDILATPMAMALVCEAGLKSQLTHVSYNNNLSQNDPSQAADMVTSAEGAASRWGISPSIVFNARQNLQGAVSNIAAQINASSADNRFILLAAGPMELVWRGIQAAQPAKREFCTVVSHGGWNESYLNAPESTHDWSSIETSGVRAIEITSQNFNYNKDYAEWNWLNTSSNPDWNWLWNRGQVAGKATFDCSDAGMAYWLVAGQGNIKGNPQQTRAIFEGNYIATGNTKTGALSADAYFSPTSSNSSVNDADILQTGGGKLILLRFKVNPGDVGSLTSATLKLFEREAKDSSSKTATFYGVPDEGTAYDETGEYFTEMEINGLNFDYTQGAPLNTAALISLGSVSYNAATENVLKLEGNPLKNFINADTNGVVTLVVAYSGSTTFYQKESDTNNPATLTWLTGSTNQAPVANAGPDQTVTDADANGSETIVLNGGGSSDDGSIVSYVWKKSGTQIATGSAPSVSLGVGTHDITLTVTDNLGAVGSDTVRVIVSAAAPTGSKIGVLVEAEQYTLDSEGQIPTIASGIRAVNGASASGGSQVGYTANGKWVKYDNFNLGSGVTNVTVSGSSPNSGGTIEFRLDSPVNPTIATVNIPVTQSWSTYQSVTVPVIGNPNGTHVLYLVVTSSGCNIDTFKFTSSTTNPSSIFSEDFESGSHNFTQMTQVQIGTNGAAQGTLPAGGVLYSWNTFAVPKVLQAGTTQLTLQTDVRLPSTEVGDVAVEMIVITKDSNGSSGKLFGGKVFLDPAFVGEWLTYQSIVPVPANVVSIEGVRVKFNQSTSSAGANLVQIDNVKVE